MPPKRTQNRKCYEQRCTVAAALDVIGDRWTLLLMRELLGGPARFQDLLKGLPGIPRNLLTNRLRQLEQDGVVRRLQSLYALTEQGEATRPIIDALGYWGTKVERVGEVSHERSPRSFAVALQAILSRRVTKATPSSVIELEVDDDVFAIALGPRATVRVQPAANPDARMRTTSALLTHYLDSVSSDEDEPLFVASSGDASARETLLGALGIAG